jgi:hypothetical protein
MKVPAAGGTFFELPDGNPAKQLHAVVMAFTVQRAFWNTEFSGEGNPPDCSSVDNIHGIGLWGSQTAEDGTVTISNGNPGGKCATCPMAAFGSGKGNSQACRQITRMLLLLEGHPMPVILSVPPGSYDAFKTYRTTILRPLGIPPHRTTTRVSLVAAQSKTGIAYSQLHFELGGEVAPELQAQIDEARALLGNALSGSVEA